MAASGLGRAAEAVGNELRMARIAGLRVARHDELVGVASAEAPLRRLLGRASLREPLAAGISLPLRGWTRSPERTAKRAGRCRWRRSAASSGWPT